MMDGLTTMPGPMSTLATRFSLGQVSLPVRFAPSTTIKDPKNDNRVVNDTDFQFAALMATERQKVFAADAGARTDPEKSQVKHENRDFAAQLEYIERSRFVPNMSSAAFFEVPRLIVTTQDGFKRLPVTEPRQGTSTAERTMSGGLSMADFLAAPKSSPSLTALHTAFVPSTSSTVQVMQSAKIGLSHAVNALSGIGGVVQYDSGKLSSRAPLEALFAGIRLPKSNLLGALTRQGVMDATFNSVPNAGFVSRTATAAIGSNGSQILALNPPKTLRLEANASQTAEFAPRRQPQAASVGPSPRR